MSIDVDRKQDVLVAPVRNITTAETGPAFHLFPMTAVGMVAELAEQAVSFKNAVSPKLEQMHFREVPGWWVPYEEELFQLVKPDDPRDRCQVRVSQLVPNSYDPTWPDHHWLTIAPMAGDHEYMVYAAGYHVMNGNRRPFEAAAIYDHDLDAAATSIGMEAVT